MFHVKLFISFYVLFVNINKPFIVLTHVRIYIYYGSILVVFYLSKRYESWISTDLNQENRKCIRHDFHCAALKVHIVNKVHLRIRYTYDSSWYVLKMYALHVNLKILLYSYGGLSGVTMRTRNNHVAIISNSLIGI